MKDQILKIAGVKTEKEFYKKYPTEESFMAKHGKKLKKAAMGTAMVKDQLEQLTDFGNPPIAEDGAAAEPAFGFTNNVKADGLGATAGAAGMGLLQNAGKIMGGLQAMGQQKKNIKNAEMSQTISGLGLEAAAGQRRNQPKNQYVRPEDNLVQPDQLGSAQGTGGNLLSMKHGGEIQNTYAPGTLYDNLEEIPRAEFGEYFQDSGQAQVGGAAGEALGSAFFGPAGGAVGKIVGQVAGNLLGGAKDARKLKAAQDATLMNQQQAAFQGVMQNQFGANMKQGGWISHDWQPQVITKFGDHRMSELLKADPTMNTLRAGGHLKNYTPPSAEAMFTGRAQDGIGVSGPMISKIELQSNTTDGKFTENLRRGISSTDTYADGRPVEKTDLYSVTKGTDGNQRFKEFIRTQTGDEAPQYSMQKSYKPLFSNQYKTVSKNINAARGERKMEDMQNFLNEGRMEDGGYMAMGGALQTHWGGDAEHMSYNPYIPGGGETVMFRGQSHDDTNGKGQSGIGITYGDNPVEVERGEPMTEMNGGGMVFGNLVMPGGKTKFKNYVADLSETEAKQNKIMDKATELALTADENDPFGRLSLNSSEASLIGANMKLKDIAKKKQDAADLQNAILDTAEEMGLVADDLAKGKIKEAKFGGKFTAQNGFNTKGMRNVTDKKTTTTTSSSKSKSKSSKAAKQELYDISEKAKYTTDYNLPSGFTPGVSALPTGMGGLKDTVLQDIQQIYPIQAKQTNIDIPFQPGYVAPKEVPGQTGYRMGDSVFGGVDLFGNYTGPQERFTDEPGQNNEKLGSKVWGALNKGVEKYGEGLLSNLAPFLRPTDQEGLDPNQLMGEQYALAMNQLEPVQAQKYQPQLGGVMDVSYQDQLNEITAQSRAAERMMQNNPEAAANLFAQVAQSKGKVLAEQNRINMAGRKQVYDENRNLLNQAQLQNLQILDQQYVRQAQAKSNTKAQAQSALNSIADKIAKNKLENRQLGIMENMYNYRFDPKGRAINMNAPAQFNIPDGIGIDNLTSDQIAKIKELNEKIVTKDKAGNITGSKEKTSTTKKSLNGSIVKAIKLKNI